MESQKNANNLNDKNTNRSPMIQSGSAIMDDGWKEHGKHGHMTLKSEGVKISTTYVAFSKEFDEIPSIHVSLSRIDTEGEVKLHVYANDITRLGFNLIFKTWNYSQIWSAEASWIAYVN